MEVLKIVFDLGDRQDTLSVFSDSNPAMIARQFCDKHNLRDEAVQIVEESIWSNLQSGMSQRASKGNIFDRLHSDAQIKAQRRQRQQAEIMLSHERSVDRKVSHNTGEELYKRGMQQMHQQEQELQKHKALQNQEVFSFQPFVSEKSQQLAPRYETKTEDHLLQLGKDMNQRKEQLRVYALAQQQQNCSFRPKLNDISEKINQEKSRNNPNQQDIHERLHQQQLLSHKKQPNESSSQFRKYPPTPGEIPFLERMQISIVEKQKKLEMSQVQQSEMSNVDQQTGQPLFHPNVGRAPSDRNSRHLPIGDYLYQMRQVKEDHQQYLQEQQSLEQRSKRAKSSEKSNQIYEDKKKRQLEEIFYLLDSDGDGTISAHMIDISNIPADILQLLAPLLCEMEQLKANLTSDQFVDAASRLLQTLPVVDRDKLLNGMKPKKSIEDGKCTFQPALNKKSLKMVSNRSPLQQSNKKQHQISKEDQQLQQCTFKPKLYEPMRIYEFMLNQ